MHVVWLSRDRRTHRRHPIPRSQEYQLLRYIDMSEVHSVSAIELKGKDYTFGIVTPRRAYYVKASSLSEMKEWISALNEIKTQMSQRNTIANDMGDLSLSPQAAAPSTSTSYPQQQQQAHAPSQQAVAKAASSAANATAMSRNIGSEPIAATCAGSRAGGASRATRRASRPRSSASRSTSPSRSGLRRASPVRPPPIR